MAMRKTDSRARAALAALAVCGAMSGLGLSQPAAAQTPTTASSNSSKAVRYDDLDLSQEAGARQLLIRVHQAARDVCMRGYETWRPYLNNHPSVRNCVIAASNRAVASLNNPMVTALYEGWSPVQIAQTSHSR